MTGNAALPTTGASTADATTAQSPTGIQERLRYGDLCHFVKFQNPFDVYSQPQLSLAFAFS